MVRRILRSAGSGVALLALSACGGGVEEAVQDVGTLWGEPSAAERAAEQQRLQALQARVPVLAVRSVEMGRTRDGFLITAFGTAPGIGYAAPTLRARRSGAPGNDGYIEYDFVAMEPAAGFNLPVGTLQARQLRADVPVLLEQLQGARGIRVMAIQGGVQLDF